MGGKNDEPRFNCDLIPRLWIQGPESTKGTTYLEPLLPYRPTQCLRVDLCRGSENPDSTPTHRTVRTEQGTSTSTPIPIFRHLSRTK